MCRAADAEWFINPVLTARTGRSGTRLPRGLQACDCQGEACPSGWKPSTKVPMPSAPQTDLVHAAMIARLEEANTRAYEQLARPDEAPSRSEADGVTDHRSDRHAHVVAPERRRSPTRRLLLAVFALLIAGVVYVAALSGQPYYDSVVRPLISRWASTWAQQTESRTETSPPDDALASSTLPVFEQRLKRMADDLQRVERQLDQLKASQDQISRSQAEVAEQFKASREQNIRDNAKIAEQLDGALAQLTRQNAGIADQLKATQEQLVGIASSQAVTSSRRPSRRKPISIIPVQQKRAQAQSPSRQP